LVVVAGGVALASAVAQGPRTVIGILPVYDNSGQSLTENLPVNLTYMIYRDLLTNAAYEPVLLNPGGLYDSDSVDSIMDYAAKAKVDVLLVSSILPCVKVNDRRCRLKMDVRMVNVATAKASAKALNDSVEVANSDLFSSIAATYVSSTYAGFFKGPQDFEKQPLGKGAMKLVEWTRGYVASTLPAMDVTPTGTASAGKPATCDMDVHIRYVTKKSASKSYTILANEKDETSRIKDGAAHFPMQSGPVMLRFEVKDAPYGMPVEKLYQASTILDCSASSQALNIDVGSAGDLLLHWQ
jgi:hypothetical protein